MRGALWMAFIAVEFYLVSNPIVFIPFFHFSLQRAGEVAVVFLLFQLPWLRLTLPRPSVVLFLGFVALSSTWSDFADMTWYTVQLYLIVGVIAWFVVANATARVVAYGLLLGGVLVVLLSLYALQQELPGASVADGIGFMAGVGTNRNILGYSLAPLCAVLAIAPRGRTARLLWGTGLAVVLVGIVLAGSATGYVAAVLTLSTVGFLLVVEHVRRHQGVRGLALVWGASALAAVLVLSQVERVAALLGRDSATFSGRVPLWEAVWTASQPQLWTGFGWGAVWQHPWQTAPANTPMDVIYYELGDPTYYPPHGHSSVFDLLPQVGLIGVALAVLIHLECLARACWSRRSAAGDTRDPAVGRMVLAMLVALVVLGLTEPLTTIPLGWFLLVILGAVDLRRPTHGALRRDLDRG